MCVIAANTLPLILLLPFLAHSLLSALYEFANLTHHHHIQCFFAKAVSNSPSSIYYLNIHPASTTTDTAYPLCKWNFLITWIILTIVLTAMVQSRPY